MISILNTAIRTFIFDIVIDAFFRSLSKSWITPNFDILNGIREFDIISITLNSRNVSVLTFEECKVERVSYNNRNNINIEFTSNYHAKVLDLHDLTIISIKKSKLELEYTMSWLR